MSVVGNIVHGSSHAFDLLQIRYTDETLRCQCVANTLSVRRINDLGRRS